MKKTSQGAVVHECCPLCGGALPQKSELDFHPDAGVVLRNGIAVRMTKSCTELFMVLYEAFPKTVSLEDISAKLYWLRTDSETPDLKIIDVMACKMNPALKKIGVKIESDWGKGRRLRIDNGEQQGESGAVGSDPFLGGDGATSRTSVGQDR